LHYHLSQHGVFSEKEMRFYATEIILGLEHMHNRFVVYRDLKVTAVAAAAFPRARAPQHRQSRGTDKLNEAAYLKPVLGKNTDHLLPFGGFSNNFST